MDKYDRNIDYLTAHPKEIASAWHEGGATHRSALFDFLARGRDAADWSIGCLTMVKKCPEATRAVTAELTQKIRDDDRIPSEACDITVAHLPVFAEYQRAVDAHYELKQID